jgi:7-cyano-7-deazaguanine synthase in queuosine biosynthesis
MDINKQSALSVKQSINRRECHLQKVYNNFRNLSILFFKFIYNYQNFIKNILFFYHLLTNFQYNNNRSLLTNKVDNWCNQDTISPISILNHTIFCTYKNTLKYTLKKKNTRKKQTHSNIIFLA